MKTKNTVMFQTLELSKRMDEVRQKAENNIFRYIRGRYANRQLTDTSRFDDILSDLRARCNAVNMQRVGTGPYLHVDGALPTDLSDGWIVISYLNVRRAQARITVTAVKGEVE